MFSHGSAPSCLQAQADARTLAVELEDAHVDLVADLDDFRRMLDALPRHVRDVQQAVDAAEVHERTVVGEVLDGTLDDRAFLQVVHERAALCGELLLHHRATRNDNVIAFLVELDDLELEWLVFEIGRVAHRAHIDERARQERADILDLDREATLHATGDDAGDDLGIVEARSRDASRCGRAWLSRGTGGFPRCHLPSESSATSTSSPCLTSISPRSFLNWSIEMTASDLRPTLTMTTSSVTSTTSPVRIMPGRMRLLARLSSKSWAKLSVIHSHMYWTSVSCEPRQMIEAVHSVPAACSFDKKNPKSFACYFQRSACAPTPAPGARPALWSER